MTDPIRNGLPSYMPTLAAPVSSYKTRQNSFQQTSIQAQETHITLVTKEGDIVTLSRSTAQSNSISATHINTPIGNGQYYTIASLSADSLSVGVQGDLNEEELADIKNLVDDLTHIASDFFSGKASASDTVLAGAMTLSDMGSVSQLSASFSYTAAISSQLAEAHPVPVFDPGPDSLTAQKDELAALQESSALEYGDILRSQWQQITEFLDRDDEDEHQAQLTKADTDTTQKMMNRIKETITQHPRLSPFALALADKAVDKAANHKPDNQQQDRAHLSKKLDKTHKTIDKTRNHRSNKIHRDIAHLSNTLKRKLFREFTNWLLPA